MKENKNQNSVFSPNHEMRQQTVLEVFTELFPILLAAFMWLIWNGSLLVGTVWLIEEKNWNPWWMAVPITSKWLNNWDYIL